MPVLLQGNVWLREARTAMSISGDRTTKGKAGEDGAPGEVVREILREAIGDRAELMGWLPPC